MNDIEKIGGTSEQLTNAISNTISHEAGHLMGLVHTDDLSGVMSDSINPNMINKTLSFNPMEVAQMNYESHLANHNSITDSSQSQFENNDLLNEHHINIELDDAIDDFDIG